MQRNKHNKLNFLWTLPLLVQLFTWASCMFSPRLSSHRLIICIRNLDLHTLPPCRSVSYQPGSFVLTCTIVLLILFPRPGSSVQFTRHVCSFHSVFTPTRWLLCWRVKCKRKIHSSPPFFFVAGTSTVKKKEEIRQTARLQSPQLLSSSEN